ncbi:MAG: hypothetical protein IPK52_12785 [Chloroflexi bacterium]|nr:hypothetical protein [Chloroflexota bacterium]
MSIRVSLLPGRPRDPALLTVMFIAGNVCSSAELRQSVEMYASKALVAALMGAQTGAFAAGQNEKHGLLAGFVSKEISALV